MEFLSYLLIGSATGVLSGLFGIGGGAVIVPALVFLLDPQLFPPAYLMHVAIGTSLATIVFTSISSARAHHRRQAVNWQVVRRIAPGIATGTLLGAWLASQISTLWLKIVFAGFLLYVATQLFLDFRPRAHNTLPGNVVLSLVGSVIGALSSLVGIGGGSLSVPFLIYCNTHVREAVGTSAAIGLPIAVAGTLGYILTGAQASGLPPYSLGFVYLPAAAGITVASAVTAPLGAKLAHQLPVPALKKLFAAMLLCLGLKMLWSVI